MHLPRRALATLLACAAMGAPGCGPGTGTPTTVSTITSFEPAVIPATGATTFTVRGVGFLAGDTTRSGAGRTSPSADWPYVATVTFTALAGSPFHGGTSATFTVHVSGVYDPPPNAVTDTVITGVITGAGVVGPVEARVDLVTGLTRASSEGAVTTFLGP